MYLIMVLAALGISLGSFGSNSVTVQDLVEIREQFHKWLDNFDVTLQREMRLLNAPVEERGKENTEMINNLRDRINKLEDQIARIEGMLSEYVRTHP